MPLAVQDYTAFTENDPSNRIRNVTSTTFDVVGLLRSDTNTWLYNDYGAGYFGDVVGDGIQCEAQVDAAANRSSLFFLNLTSNVGNFQNHLDNNWDGYFLAFNQSAGGVLQMILWATGGGVNLSDASAYVLSQRRYFTLTRSGTTVTVRIYSDSARTALVDTIAVTNQGTTLRYMFACGAFGVAQNNAMSGDVANHSLPFFVGGGGHASKIAMKRHLIRC
jgi:hypothetical protein